MNSLVLKFGLAILFMFGAASSEAQFPPPQQPAFQYVGIPSNQMNYFSAAQEDSQWCWAASIQMVLNYYGVDINQRQIVARTYGVSPDGRLPNWGGSLQAITANLNNWNVDNRGRHYTVSAVINQGPPTPAIMVQELGAGRPLIVGYRTGPNSAHAVVITAVSFFPSQQGPMIRSIVVRDPWPSPQNIQSGGRHEHPAANLARFMDAHWYIRVN